MAHLVVLDDLGDEVAGAQVVADRHPHPQRARGGVVREQVLHHRLGVAVEGLVEVGRVRFGETGAADDVRIVIFENASCGVEQVVDAALFADISDVQATDDIRADRFRLVVFAPARRKWSQQRR